MLLVRRGGRRRDGVTVFLARTGRELRRLELERHDELVGADLDHAGDAVPGALFLVCTHGKHDRCCARLGRPLYDAIREQVDEDAVWQCSHVGGDRFAGNLVVLPDGVYYGRVDVADAWPLVDAALAGRIHLPSYRGRASQSFPAQAAELAVREATGLLGVADVEVVALERQGDGWRADVRAGGAAYEVDVRVEPGAPTHLTCAADGLRRPERYVAGSPRARAA